MKKSEIIVGKTYLMKHTSGWIPVTVHAERSTSTGFHRNNTRTHWTATNLKTGREITVKSAVRLRKEITQKDVDMMLGRKPTPAAPTTPPNPPAPVQAKGWY
jgi:hypothetical protein